LKWLPAAARAGLRLPPKYCATPAEAARRPEDVLPYVPAECWPRLLLLLPSAVGDGGGGGGGGDGVKERTIVEEGVRTLLGSLVRQELENLPRSVYHLSQAMQNAGAEPVNYNHLPDHSVLRYRVPTFTSLLEICPPVYSRMYTAPATSADITTGKHQHTYKTRPTLHI
jgi:hypothetical protein